MHTCIVFTIIALMLICRYMNKSVEGMIGSSGDTGATGDAGATGIFGDTGDTGPPDTSASLIEEDDDDTPTPLKNKKNKLMTMTSLSENSRQYGGINYFK